MCLETGFRINSDTNIYLVILDAHNLVHKKGTLLAPSFATTLAIFCSICEVIRLAFCGAAAIAGLQYRASKTNCKSVSFNSPTSLFLCLFNRNTQQQFRVLFKFNSAAYLIILARLLSIFYQLQRLRIQSVKTSLCISRSASLHEHPDIQHRSDISSLTIYCILAQLQQLLDVLFTLQRPKHTAQFILVQFLLPLRT